MLRIFSIVLLIATSLFFFKAQAFANPDDLLIRDDGMVILLVSQGSVLASQAKPNKKDETPPSSKAVPLVPAHTEATVKITSPINNERKVQVTITPKPQTATPQVPSQIRSPQPTSPTNTITKTVDQVVAQGANGQIVFSIKSDQANELTIKQGNTKVSTSLPLQIDTTTHSISVTSDNGPSKVSVLPSEAIKGIIDKGILDSKSISQAKIDLTKDTNGLNYTLQGQESKKLFGSLNVKYPVEVKLSAENGKVVNISKPVLFELFRNFLK